jgi:hypothetical protein
VQAVLHLAHPAVFSVRHLRLSCGRACGGRTAKVKPAADAGPTAPRGAGPLSANTLSKSARLGSG